jgi:hypothetical protein
LGTPVSKAAAAAAFGGTVVAGLGEQPLAAAGHDRDYEQVQFGPWASRSSQLTWVPQYRAVSWCW